MEENPNSSVTHKTTVSVGRDGEQDKVTRDLGKRRRNLFKKKHHRGSLEQRVGEIKGEDSPERSQQGICPVQGRKR